MPIRFAVVLLVASISFAQAAHAGVVSRVSRLTVYDARGTKVGSELLGGGPSQAVVALRISGQLVALAIDRNQFVGFGTPLFFESTDCTGAMWMFTQNDSPTLVPAGTIYAPGGTVYIP